MAAKTEQKTILLISKNEILITETHSKLSKMESLRLIEKDVTSENLKAVMAEVKPDVVLLDYDLQIHHSTLLDRITSEYPINPVVVILPEFEMVNSDKVLRLGARAFVPYPYQSDYLVVAIKRVLELKVRKEDYLFRIPVIDRDIKPKNTFTVFSPKGGVGTSTIAVNLAISLHQILKEDVLLVDGKHYFGHIALFLNLRTGNSITDLITHANMLDEQLIKQVAVRHSSGIYVLPSPNSITEAQGIKPEDLFKVIQGLQLVFPNVVIDGGNNLNENTVTYMDSSDKILLVLNPDLASMRDVKQFIQISSTLSYPKEKMLLILNLTGRKANIKREEIENILKMETFGRVPADDNLALGCLNEGIPILLKKPRHPISEAFLKIAQDLGNLTQPSTAE